MLNETRPVDSKESSVVGCPFDRPKKNPSTVGFNRSFSAIFHGVPGTLGLSHASKASLGEVGMVRSTVTSKVLVLFIASYSSVVA
jgi:hypothetical protein